MSAHTFCLKCGQAVFWIGRDALNVSDGKNHVASCRPRETHPAVLADRKPRKKKKGRAVLHQGRKPSVTP